RNNGTAQHQRCRADERGVRLEMIEQQICGDAEEGDVKEKEQRVRGRKRQHEKQPLRRIENTRLRIREPRLARRVVRIPERQTSVAQNAGRVIAKRLEVIGVIAQREDFVAQKWRRENRQRRRDQKRERSATHHCSRAQNSRTIERTRRVPSAKKFSRMRSSFPCTVSAS